MILSKLLVSEQLYIRGLRTFQQNTKLNTQRRLINGQFREKFPKKKVVIEQIPVESGPIRFNTLGKTFAFTLGFSVITVAGCAIWQYEALRSHAKQFLRKPVSWYNAHQHQQKTRTDYNIAERWWRSLRDHEKIFFPILAANLAVFLSWRVRPFQNFMIKYFCSNPSGSTLCSPMLLSAFSHYSAFHLAANMYVLHSFMPGAVAALGKEQFVCLYGVAAVFSSFTSYLFKAIARAPGLSLGASGAIMAVLSYVCTAYPDTKLSIIFLPMYTFAAGTAIKFIIGLDAAGVLLGWRLFDHAAHLGGSILGIAWFYWGSKYIWGNREVFVQYWHSMRETAQR